MNKAQQNVIEGKHVIRIPITNNSALFFTKNKGGLLAYINQWTDKAPGQKQFSGNIMSWSFQTNTIVASVYDHSAVTSSKYYKTPGKAIALNGARLKINDDNPSGDNSSNGFFTFFEKMLCLLRGGQYISQADIDNGDAFGANGHIGETGCDMTGASTTPGGNDYPTILPDFGPIFGIPNITVTDLGANGAYGAGYGNNYIWVTTYIPPSGNCLPGAGQGFNPDVPLDGDCIYGHWQYYQRAVLTETCSITMCRDTSITNNTRLNRIFDLLDGQNPVFDSLSAAYKNSYNYDLKFFQDQPTSGVSAHTLFIPGGTLSNRYGTALVSLNRQYVHDNINDYYVDIIRSILHETWHAELYQFLLSNYNTTDLDKIALVYNKGVSDLTTTELIDLLNVDINNHKMINATYVITAINGWDKSQHHNYMAKSVDVLAKGVNQFLIKINSPLANNMEFCYAEALSTLRIQSNYFNDPTNLIEFASKLPNFITSNLSLYDYIGIVWSNNRGQAGQLP